MNHRIGEGIPTLRHARYERVSSRLRESWSGVRRSELGDRACGRWERGR
jgi:hypothetical protein